MKQANYQVYIGLRCTKINSNMIQFSNNELKWYDKQDLVVAVWFKVNVGIVIEWKKANQTLYCSQ